MPNSSNGRGHLIAAYIIIAVLAATIYYEKRSRSDRQLDFDTMTGRTLRIRNSETNQVTVINPGELLLYDGVSETPRIRLESSESEASLAAYYEGTTPFVLVSTKDGAGSVSVYNQVGQMLFEYPKRGKAQGAQ